MLDYEKYNPDVTPPVIPEMDASCFRGMFSDQDAITSVADLKFPESGISSNCFASMFSNCTNLTIGPSSLPAYQTAKYCYANMFSGCSSLLTAPSLYGGLDLSTLADYCYTQMFKDCTSLVTAPSLDAYLLGEGCYQQMFRGCTSLAACPDLPATQLQAKCYMYMFRGCKSIASPYTFTYIDDVARDCFTGMYQDCTLMSVYTESRALYRREWKIKIDGGTLVDTYATDMFKGTSGTFQGTPEVNTSYYVYGGLDDGITMISSGQFTVSAQKH